MIVADFRVKSKSGILSLCVFCSSLLRIFVGRGRACSENCREFSFPQIRKIYYNVIECFSALKIECLIVYLKIILILDGFS